MSVRKLGHGRKGYHIETEGAIINVYEGLTDIKGRKVNAVEIIPDKFAGEPKWKVIGSKYNKIVQLKKVV